MENNKSIFCDCLYFSANSLARNLTKLAEDAFAVTGLAPSHAFALMVINRKPGVSPSEIAKEMHMMPSTITRFLDKLELKGYISRNSEGKTSELFPTEKGKEIYPKLGEAWYSLLENYNSIIGKEEAAELATRLYDASEKMK